MPSDPVRRGLDWRLPSLIRNAVFLACLALSLTITAVAFSSYQEHKAYSDYCKASAHTGEQGCKAEKPFGESVFGDPVVFFAAVTALFTGGLIFVGIAQAGLFWWQLNLIREGLTDTEDAAKAAQEQARLARDSLVAGNRAWLRIDARVGGNLVLNQDVASFSVAVELENIGNSVAHDIRFEAWLVAPKTMGPRPIVTESAIYAHRELCEHSRLYREATGFLLYPGEKFPSVQGFSLFSIGAMMDSEMLSERSFPQQLNEKTRAIPLCVGGVVNYRFPTDSKVHQSSFLFALTYKGVDIAFDFDRGIWKEADLVMIGIHEGDGRQAD